MPGDTLSLYAQSHPDKPGVIDDRPDGTVVTWTYAEFDAQANRVANLLGSLGAGPRKKVLWCGPNSLQVVAVMSATRKIGAVAVPLNYRLTPDEALYVINHSDAEVAYVDYEHAPMFAALRGQLEKVRHIIAVGGPVTETPDGMLTDADIAAAPADAPDVGDAEGTGGTMIYTSGTTGKPKGAVREGPPDPELLGEAVRRPEDQMSKPGSCGNPAPGIEIALLDADGNEVTGTGPDHAGEVFVRSKGAFDTYYKNDASYESNSRGDYHTVGDVAYWDDEGYLYICDRKTDMIISGGMNIYPAEIEAALEQHPEIYDVAVFGIPSEEWGEVVQ